MTLPKWIPRRLLLCQVIKRVNKTSPTVDWCSVVCSFWCWKLEALWWTSSSCASLHQMANQVRWIEHCVILMKLVQSKMKLFLVYIEYTSISGSRIYSRPTCWPGIKIQGKFCAVREPALSRLIRVSAKLGKPRWVENWPSLGGYTCALTVDGPGFVLIQLTPSCTTTGLVLSGVLVMWDVERLTVLSERKQELYGPTGAHQELGHASQILYTSPQQTSLAVRWPCNIQM